ncbi:alpha/beta hydrolase [Halobacteriales archaeon QS_8_69_26]|nr:MAG: alpha/beta hydrolase [Halobacteriales archaeon QS_8_69_26]
MPIATNRGVDLYYERDGPTDADPVAFVGDAGLGAWLWGWQYRAVAGRHGAVTWDLRGTGRSSTPEGPYSVAALAADLEAVLADAGVRHAHVVGAGLGGMVALGYALAYGRARSLALFGTAAAGAELAGSGDAEDTSGDPGLSAACADPDDPEALRDSLSNLLSAEFRDEQPEVVDGVVDWRSEDDADPEACRWQAAAAADVDRRDSLHEVTVPALVVHGTADRIVPVEAGRRLADGLPRGEFAAHDGAGHLVGVERSRPVNDRLLAFLDSIGED